jgi:hypothetical protein
MREIIILNCYEIETIGVLITVFTEMCGAFIRKGYKLKVITNINELHNNSIILMGNTFNHKNPSELLNKYAPEAIYIGWYWQDINVDTIKYFIHTYENMLDITYSKQRYPELLKLRETKYNCPLMLRSNEDSEKIGSFHRSDKLDYCYMGSPYSLHLKPSNNFRGIFHLVYSPDDYISYEKRKKIYLSSIFSLGLQSIENTQSKHVSQRIYEALTYGCIVLTNSIPACEQTNNIAIYVSSKEDLEDKMVYYKNNPQLILKKQLEGYEFSKKYGTNEYSIQQFINIIENKMKLDV